MDSNLGLYLIGIIVTIQVYAFIRDKAFLICCSNLLQVNGKVHPCTSSASYDTEAARRGTAILLCRAVSAINPDPSIGWRLDVRPPSRTDDETHASWLCKKAGAGGDIYKIRVDELKIKNGRTGTSILSGGVAHHRVVPDISSSICLFRLPAFILAYRITSTVYQVRRRRGRPKRNGNDTAICMQRALGIDAQPAHCTFNNIMTYFNVIFPIATRRWKPGSSVALSGHLREL